MSTIFAIISEETKEPIEIAHRYNIGQGKVAIKALHPVLPLLNEDLEVVAIDNSSQGINTIGDIVNHEGYIPYSK